MTANINALAFPAVIEPSFSWMTTGTVSGTPTTGTDDGTGIGGTSFAWTGPNNLRLNDPGLPARNDSLALHTNTHYLKGSGYGFALPSTATVFGIQLNVLRQSFVSGSGVITDLHVHLIKGGVIQTFEKSNGATWPTTGFVTRSYGGPGDLWGSSWSPTDINSASFGAAIAATCTASGGGGADVASMGLTVYASVGTLTSSVTFGGTTLVSPAANVGSPVTFTAATQIDSASASPPISIIEYRWDFGDGTVGYGNPAVHTYSVANAQAAATLRVTDSLGRRWYARQQLYL